MDTLLGILRRAALIGESRPDRGYAAIDRRRAFGARVGRRVGGSRIHIEQMASSRSSSLSIDSRARGPRRPERGRQRDPLGPAAGRRRRFPVFGLGANAGARAFAAIAAAPASYRVIAKVRH